MADDTLNIVGSKLYLVSATSVTGTTGVTNISGVVVVEDLPGTEAVMRDVTELADYMDSFRIGKRKKLVGELVYVVHLTDAATHVDRTGTEAFVRCDIPVEGTSTTATNYVQIMMHVGFKGDKLQPGDETNDVTRRITAGPMGPTSANTAAY